MNHDAARAPSFGFGLATMIPEGYGIETVDPGQKIGMLFGGTLAKFGISEISASP